MTDAYLYIIALMLFLMLLFKDMSGKDELHKIATELKEIREALDQLRKVR